MKHSSNNQGGFTTEEYEAMHRDARRKRYIDMITVLEHNGFKISARQEAMDQENIQMISILKSRGFLVIDKKISSENDKMEMKTLLTTWNNKGEEIEEIQEGLEEEKTTRAES